MSTRKPSQLELTLEGGLGFDYEIKRSARRRRLEISIREGRVRLLLPTFVSDAAGRDFLRRKRQWILQTLDKHRQWQSEIPLRRYCDGEAFHYLGRPYYLRVHHNAPRGSVRLNGDWLEVFVSRRQRQPERSAIEGYVQAWYRREARRLLEDKTRCAAEKLGRSYRGVRLRRTKSKWGHCTAEGMIQYNWQIIAAPEAVVDYLVAHEVCHLVHLNHGKRFWRLVERLCPDYREQRRWLRDRGHTIHL